MNPQVQLFIDPCITFHLPSRLLEQLFARLHALANCSLPNPAPDNSSFPNSLAITLQEHAPDLPPVILQKEGETGLA